MSAFDESQISEVRQIVRLEALRAAVYSLASENLDENITRFSVFCSVEEDSLAAEIQWYGPKGHSVGGGRL